jgi:TPP-dependent pyruvate/acetoin dehydrogenase alpha subunit
LHRLWRISLISNEKLIAIYAAMLRCRMIGQRARSLFQQDKLRNNLLPMGREASTVASVIDLGREDTLCLHDDDLMPGIVKGASPEHVLRALATARKDQTLDDSLSRAAEFDRLNILLTPTAESQIRAVRERAQAAKRGKKGRVVLAFPCSSESRAKWDEAMRLAGLRNLPIVFVFYDAWKPEGGAGPREAMLNGLPAMVVDAGDAVAIYRVACEAIARARQGRGPSIVECVTVHDGGATSPAAGRIHIESEHPVPNDPILTMEDYLKRKGLWSEPSYRQWVADYGRELDLATRFMRDESNAVEHRAQ